MHWNKVSVTVSPEQAEAIESLLWALGAVSVTFSDSQDNPIFEPPVGEHPLWQQSEMSALFEQESDLSAITDAIAAESDASVHVEALVERAWEREWLDQFKPMAFGDRLWIVPSAYDSPKDAEVVLRLDPGLAFGTGTHPTTAMCLRALDANLPPGKRVVDFGCGSGILGIAAARLGATAVLGVDNDPQAITASRDNALRNEVPDAAFSVVLPQDGLIANWQASADWVLANILAGPLVALAPVLTALMAPRGRLLLAGLLVDQAEAVVEAYAPRVALSIADQQEGWVLLAGEKR